MVQGTRSKIYASFETYLILSQSILKSVPILDQNVFKIYNPISNQIFYGR
jgi:hypothetical protein